MVIQGAPQVATRHLQIDMMLTKVLIEILEHLIFFPMAIEYMILLAMYGNMLWLIVAILCSTIFQMMAEQVGEDMLNYQLSQPQEICHL